MLDVTPASHVMGTERQKLKKWYRCPLLFSSPYKIHNRDISTLTPEEKFKDAILYFISDVSILSFLVSVCVGLEGRRGVTTTLSVINHNFKVYCWSHAKSRRYCIYCPPKKRSRCADTPMGHIRHKI